MSPPLFLSCSPFFSQRVSLNLTNIVTRTNGNNSLCTPRQCFRIQVTSNLLETLSLCPNYPLRSLRLFAQDVKLITTLN
jgi:hypothetical protein